MGRQANPPRITVHQIPAGDAGAFATLDRMRSLVNASLVDPVVIETARAIVAAIAPRRYADQVAALRSWIADHFLFVKDPYGVELLSTPRLMLDTIAARFFVRGDCDDAAILAAALGKAIGLRARFVALGFVGPRAPLIHVFAQLNIPGGDVWREMDTSRPGGPAPESTRAVMREV